MKRKRPPSDEPAVPESPAPDTLATEALIERARRAIESNSMKGSKCVVCGEDCAPNSAEGLCWVCRRLKFSAWRDSDTQMPAQE